MVRSFSGVGRSTSASRSDLRRLLLHRLAYALPHIFLQCPDGLLEAVAIGVELMAPRDVDQVAESVVIKGFSHSRVLAGEARVVGHTTQYLEGCNTRIVCCFSFVIHPSGP